MSSAVMMNGSRFKLWHPLNVLNLGLCGRMCVCMGGFKKRDDGPDKKGAYEGRGGSSSPPAIYILNVIT